MPTPTKKKRLSLNKVLALLLLYSVQGIPFGFFLFTFPLHLRGQGMGLGKITFLSIVNLPWLVKFLWAPLVDKYWFPRLGRRKSWIWPAQGFLIVALVVTGLLVSRLSLVGFLVALTVINLFASTQDIAVDGLAVDILEEWERGMGNAIQAAAFKIGMLGGGFGLTFVLSYYSIATCFYLMAAAVFVVSLAPFLVREPPPIGEEAAASGRQVILGLLTTWFRRPGTLVFLAFLLFAKAGDALANPLFRLYLRDAAVSLGDINTVMNLGGMVATLLGSLATGLLIHRFGRGWVLFIGLSGQGLSHLFWALLSVVGVSMGLLWGVALFEHFISGVLTVVIFTLMMDSVDRRAGGTLYTLLMCFHLGAVFLLGIFSGFFVQWGGYTLIFTIAGGLTLFTLILYPHLRRGGFLSGRREECGA